MKISVSKEIMYGHSIVTSCITFFLKYFSCEHIEFSKELTYKYALDVDGDKPSSTTTKQLCKKAKLKTFDGDSTKTTLVLMGFSPKRIPNYEILFKAYGSMTDVLDKIIFIWNNQDVDPPHVPTTDVNIKNGIHKSIQW